MIGYEYKRARRPLRLRHAAVATAVLSTAVFAALAIAAASQWISPIDRAVQTWVQHKRSPALDLPMRCLSVLGSGWVLVAVGAAAYVVLWRVGHVLARPIPALASGAFLLLELTKWLTSRPRPDGSAYGFPSGHTMGATVFFGYLVWWVWHGQWRSRWLASVAAGLLVSGIAYCRLYFNVHWLTDVVGGFSGGLAYLIVALLVALQRCPPWKPP
jgi:undecaprenyl-diphosphatase